MENNNNDLRMDGTKRSVPTKVNEWIDNDTGHMMVQYESGMIRDETMGRISKPPDKPYITKDNAQQLLKHRRQLTMDALQEEISKLIYGKEVATKPAEAIAYVGAKLFKEIVMDEDANPMHRLNTYLAIGRQAGILKDERYTKEEDNDGVTVSIGLNLARELVDRMRNERQDS